MMKPPTMDQALGLLGLRPKDFPLEVTLASGETRFLPAPEHVQMHPNKKMIILFPEDSFIEHIYPADVAAVKRRGGVKAWLRRLF